MTSLDYDNLPPEDQSLSCVNTLPVTSKEAGITPWGTSLACDNLSLEDQSLSCVNTLPVTSKEAVMTPLGDQLGR